MRLAIDHRWILFSLVLCLMASGAGCTKSFMIRPVSTPRNSYPPAAKAAEPGTFAIHDARIGDAKPINTGTLNVELTGISDEISFLGESLARVLGAEGIRVAYVPSGRGDLKLDVHTYRIRNLRTSGYSPYHTFTSFSADLTAGYGPPQRITAYFKNSKTPVWAFSELERPCYQIPLEVVVKEIAAKLNARAFGRVASTDMVKSLASSIPTTESDTASEQYLRVLELGYTNNPAAIGPLVRLTRREETLMRASAVSALGMLRAVDQMPLLARIYEKDDGIVKAMALKSIGDLGTPESREFLARVEKSEEYRDDESLREVVGLYR